MKRSTRVFGDTLLWSGRRLFASRNEERVKRMRLTSFAVVDTQKSRIDLLDHEEQERAIRFGESKKVNEHGTDGIIEIDHEERREIEGTDGVVGTDGEEQGEIKLGESKKISLVDDTRDEGDNQSHTKKFGAVYTRKRKRTKAGDSSSQCTKLEENCGSDKMFENKYFKKKRVKTSLGLTNFNSNLGFHGKDALWKGPIIFSGLCSYTSGVSSSSIYRFSSFVSSVLRYMRKVKVFSWRQFSSFVLSELTSSIYSSIGIRFSQESTCTMSHGFLKVFGSVLSLPFFTIDFMSLPFCFLYMHSSLLLYFAFRSYALILHPVLENVTDDNVKVPLIATGLNQFVVPTKARSITKRVPRVSLFKKCRAHVKNIVPVPGVREVAGYEEEKYVPFRLPESYISSRSDEVTRTLQRSYSVYDMDSVDEEWLNKFNNESFGANDTLSEDTFEKVIDAFERGNYCSPGDFSDATSAINRCLGLASKEVLEAVYRYWMAKRKKKRSPLIRVFQCYQRRRVRKHATNVVPRKKRSARTRKSQHWVGKHVDFVEAMMSEEKTMEEAAKAYMKVHETQEEARRSEEAAIVKRKEAQALMEAADLATYRATMALRIAEARAATISFFSE